MALHVLRHLLERRLSYETGESFDLLRHLRFSLGVCEACIPGRERNPGRGGWQRQVHIGVAPCRRSGLSAVAHRCNGEALMRPAGTAGNRTGVSKKYSRQQAPSFRYLQR
jgi:hypothetical protein